MNTWRASVIAGALALLSAMLAGCVVPDGGYGYYDEGVDIGADYYQSDDMGYEGWEPGYEVGPYRGGGHRPEGGSGHRPEGGGHPHPPAYRPAPASHPAPSIPTRPRSKGGRSH